MIGIGNESSFLGGAPADAALNQRQQPAAADRPIQLFTPPTQNPPPNRVSDPERVQQVLNEEQQAKDAAGDFHTAGKGRLVDVRV